MSARAAAVTALGCLKPLPAGAEELLFHLASHAEEPMDVRAAAVTALGKLKPLPAGAEGLLFHLASHAEEPMDVRAAAVTALGKLKPLPAGAEGLLFHLASRSEEPPSVRAVPAAKLVGMLALLWKVAKPVLAIGAIASAYDALQTRTPPTRAEQIRFWQE